MDEDEAGGWTTDDGRLWKLRSQNRNYGGGRRSSPRAGPGFRRSLCGGSQHCWGPVTGEQRLRVAVQCGAENRGEQESVSPGSREVAIVTPKPASPPSSISDAPPRPPTPRCPGWRLGRPPPGPTSSRSLSRFRPRFFLLLTRSSWGQDPPSSCRLCHHLLLRGTWPPQGLSPGLSTCLSPKRRHDPTGPLAQTHGGFPQPLDVGAARAVPLLGRGHAARGPAGAGGPRHPLLLPPSLRP